MRKRRLTLLAAAASFAALTVSATPAQANPANVYNTQVDFFNGSWYCLDIPNNHAVVGQPLQAALCNGTDAQGWNKIYTDSYHFELQSWSNGDLCANNWQGGDRSGNDIKLYYCNGNADGTWNEVSNGDGTREIQPKSAVNTCLNIWGGLAPGHLAKLYQCAKVDNETVYWLYG